MTRLRLPEPPMDGLGVFDALRVRRSVRSFREEGIPLEHLSALLWAGQGAVGVRGAS